MGATPSQRKVRQAFKKCCNCFNLQPQTGGATYPDVGPRSREWWYDEAGDVWYYNYFIAQSMPLYLAGTTPDWCKYPPVTFNGIFSYGYNGEDYDEITDSIELPTGNTGHRYWLDNAVYRSFAFFSTSIFTEEQINNAGSLSLVFYSVALTFTQPFSVICKTVLNPPSAYFPDFDSIVTSGNIIGSFNGQISQSITLPLLDYWKYLYANDFSLGFVVFQGSVENYSSTRRDSLIYGTEHPDTPAFLTLGI